MGGSSKGSQFERDLCRTLSLHFSNGTADDWFWRTSGSGSRATNLSASGKDLTKYQVGDMAPIRPEGVPLCDVFSFEFKFYSGIDLHGIFHSVAPERSLLSFWAKCVRDAEASERVPAMVTKVNNGVPILWVPVRLLSILSQAGYHVSCNRALQFWFPACEVVAKRTYKRLGKGRKKAKKGKGTPRKEMYTFPEPQHVVGIELDTVLSCFKEPTGMVEFLRERLSELPVPKRKDCTSGPA